MTNIVGIVKFDNKILSVYSSLDEPLFRASDIAKLIDYSEGNTWKLLELCEEDEKVTLPLVVSGQRRNTSFVTETGLYNILAQSRKPIARKWRRVIFNELVELRKSRGLDISGQFDEWDHALDRIFWDEEKSMLVEYVNTPGGDVMAIPYEG